MVGPITWIPYFSKGIKVLSCFDLCGNLHNGHVRRDKGKAASPVGPANTAVDAADGDDFTDNFTANTILVKLPLD